MKDVDHEDRQQRLRNAVTRAVEKKGHRAVLFTDLASVPDGSIGYFSPSGRSAQYTNGRWRPAAPHGTKFTSHSGPANDAALVQAVIDEIDLDSGLHHEN